MTERYNSLIIFPSSELFTPELLQSKLLNLQKIIAYMLEWYKGELSKRFDLFY